VTAVNNTQQPRALIVTVYGLYAREVGGWLSVATLIRLLAELDVDAPAVRSSISRLKRRGLLVPSQLGSVAGYGLSDSARAILDEGDRRIFARQRSALADGWVLAVFSVPESEREKRHQLRSRLSWLGFGTVGAGVWVAPAHVAPEALDVLRRHRLDSYVDLFQASPFSEVHIGQWWDLGTLSSLYDDFLARHSAVLARYRRRSRFADREAFVDYVRALTDWRRLPYSDPGLPLEILPRDWPGIRAADTFFELRDRLAPAAHTYVDTIRG